MLRVLERDILREIGSMGASHAANSLSAMIGEKVVIEVPRLEMIPVERIPSYVGGSEELTTGVFVKYQGDLDATFMVLFPYEASLELVDIMMGRRVGSTARISDMEASVIQEVGSIMASHFANALSDFLGFKIVPTFPAFACDMAGAMLDFLTVDIGQKVDKTIFFSTTFHSSSKEIRGYLFLAPEMKSLRRIFNAIEVKYRT
jgi:chemotaxis protein CheC